MPGRHHDVITIVINAAIDASTGSGAERALESLVSGIGQLTDGAETYICLTSPLAPRWIERHLGTNSRIVVAPVSLGDGLGVRTTRLRQAARRALGPLAPAVRAAERVVRAAVRRAGSATDTSSVAGFIEALNPDVVHFPFQQFVSTRIPAIFEPWDLQHLHLPELFDAAELRRRAALYESACREAAAVVVGSRWVRRDLIDRFGLRAEKIYVIRRAAPIDLLPDAGSGGPEQARRRHRLPDSFALYPAQTWRHKNHLGLVEAVGLLRARGQEVTIVCTGTLTEHSRQIRRRIAELGLEQHIRLLGYVHETELRDLYAAARCLVMPSLFEGYGLPLLEAFAVGVPVTSAAVTCLPELAGDAALFFDPSSVGAIASALARMWEDDALRATLVERGKRRLVLFDGVVAARTFRALYRSVGSAGSAPDDERLLRAALSENSMPAPDLA